MSKNNIMKLISLIIIISFTTQVFTMAPEQDKKVFSNINENSIKYFLAIKIIQKIVNEYALENDVSLEARKYPLIGYSHKSTEQGLFLETNESNGLLNLISPWGSSTIPLSKYGQTHQTVGDSWNNIKIGGITVDKYIYSRSLPITYHYPILKVEGIEFPDAKLSSKGDLTQEQVNNLWDEMESQENLYKTMQDTKTKINPEWEKIRTSFNTSL